MLSYRHSFHAGNFADVLKHIVLVEILTYLSLKETPFEVIDTHAGAGLFDLQSLDAVKLNEHEAGIARLDPATFPELASYFEVIESVNSSAAVDCYPGSPVITKHFLRRQDRAWLFELHPQDFALLQQNMQGNKKIRVAPEDGLQGMLRLLPPTSRRGLVLIDPSYEVKTEYDQVVDCLVKAYKKFSGGTYALWYPVTERRRIEHMERKLQLSGIKNIQRFELGRSVDKAGRGMDAAGLFVINPPWTLFNKMTDLLPKLAKAIAGEAAGYGGRLYKCDVIVKE